MKELIYTIPIIKSFEENSECAFCSMMKKIEDDSINFMLGSAYMEDNIRMETNKKGFCKNHFEEMYSKENRLGLALMIETNFIDTNKNLADKFNDLEKSLHNKSNEKNKKFSFKKREENFEFNNLIEYLNKNSNSCYICERNDYTFFRYINNFFHLYKNNHEILEYIKNSNGFCIPHFTILLKEGKKFLNEKQMEDFLKLIIPIQKENLNRVSEDISWFINKCDYKYKNEPWKNSKDSIQRSIQKLSSSTKNLFDKKIKEQLNEK